MNFKRLLFTSLLAAVALQPACSDTVEPADPTPDAAMDPVPGPLAITTSGATLPILQGTSGTIEVTVTRQSGLTGPVVIAPVGLPEGVTADPLTIATDATTGTLTLHTTDATPHSLPTTVAVRGTLGEITAARDVIVTVYGAPGTLDTSFHGGAMMMPAGISDDYASAVVTQDDGKIVIGGVAAEHGGDFALIRLDRDGNLDPTFGTNGTVLTDFDGAADALNGLAIQPDGKIIAVGSTVGSSTSKDFAVVRYLPDGTLDTSFSGDGKIATPLGFDSDTAYAVVVQADGKIVVGGDSNFGSSQTGKDFAVVRYTSVGGIDADFGPGGIVTTPIASGDGGDSIYALALQTIDGEERIVAAGGEGDFTIVRYRANGTLDASFDGDGKLSKLFGSTMGAARAITIGASNTITLAGHAEHDVALAQLTSSGGLDPSFSTDGLVVTKVSSTTWDEAQAMRADADGNLVVAGWVYEGNSSAGNFVVLRYLANGSLDTAFAKTGIVQTPVAAPGKRDQAMAVAIQHDARIPMDRIVAAGFASVTNSDFAVARYWR